MNVLPAVFLLAVLCFVWLRHRVRLPFRPDVGPYYFADGCLVLNYKIPEAYLLDSIARVEPALRNGDGSHENLLVHVLPRNGRTYSCQFRNAPPGSGRRWKTAGSGACGYERFANDGFRVGQAGLNVLQ